MSIDLSDPVIAALRRARRLTVLTGAGISAESGVPTFRDAQTGLWSQYEPTQLATAQAFRSDPKLVWDWYQWRCDLVAKATPNAGHLALAQLESRFSERGTRFTLITQNVDGLHQQAGSRAVIELHGNIRRTKCFTEDEVVESWPPTDETPPRCPRCGGLLRPDVVWFGEPLPRAAVKTALEASQACDVFLSIGTSALVQPAASLPLIALAQGAVVLEINPDKTPLTARLTGALRGPAGKILPELVQQFFAVVR